MLFSMLIEIRLLGDVKRGSRINDSDVCRLEVLECLHRFPIL